MYGELNVYFDVAECRTWDDLVTMIMRDPILRVPSKQFRVYHVLSDRKVCVQHIAFLEQNQVYKIELFE
jgi:hypothetical protein